MNMVELLRYRKIKSIIKDEIRENLDNFSLDFVGGE